MTGKMKSCVMGLMMGCCGKPLPIASKKEPVPVGAEPLDRTSMLMWWLIGRRIVETRPRHSGDPIFAILDEAIFDISILA